MTRPRKLAVVPRGDPEATALAVEKLASSGLPPGQLEALGMEALAGDAVARLHRSFRARPALRIPYLDPWGAPGAPLTAWPAWPGFYRLRYLRGGTDFADLAEKRPLRYTQEPDSGICAYFPANVHVPWPDVLGDPAHRLLITEGELKAAKACLEGFPTVGLGGVHNWRCPKLGVAFLPELERVAWLRREVYLVFDSDVQTNEAVREALNRLAEELARRGALPYFVLLPDVVEGGKTGLDDYLLARPAGDLDLLLRDRAQPLTLVRSLWALNEEVAYVHDPGLVLVAETGQKLKPGPFAEHAFAHRAHAEQVVRADGSLSLKAVPAAAAWLAWPLRREAGALTYAPGRPRGLLPGATVRASRWNTWPGWGVEPAAGDAAPFLRLVAHLFTGADPAAATWFLRWCAAPLQTPGLKMFTSVLVHGVGHGTGKTLVGYTLARIYGANFSEIRQADLHGSFNEWAVGKQFVLGDDITGSDKREDNDRLKTLISQRTMTINAKHLPTYVLPDCINYYFTANQPDAFFLEDRDRRNFIHEVLATTEPLDAAFYADYDLWLDGGGAAAVFDHLLRLDLGDFNPAAPALRTAAKERMIADVQSDLAAWVRALVADPDRFLRVGDVPLAGDLHTNRALLALYDPLGATRTTANGLGRELKRAGVAQACGGAPVRTAAGQDRYYALRDGARWAAAPAAEAAAHLARPAPTAARKKY